MNRRQFEHAVAAASAIAHDDELIVVGSQAILGQYPTAPATLLESMEVRLYPKNFPERAELIDRTLGEGSGFHDTYGYFARGVDPESAVLPRGWEERLVPLRSDERPGVTGWCLEIHDLVIGKCIDGEDKDRRFLSASHAAGFVRLETLRDRLAGTAADSNAIDRTEEWIATLTTQSH